MNRDLLLEIGVEEMPAAFMDPALQDLKEIARQKLEEKRISFAAIHSYGTPRRIVLHIDELADKQQDAHLKTRGPRKSAAFVQQGQPTKAALGFARSQGMDVADLIIEEQNGSDYLFAVKREEGQKTIDLLPEILLSMIQALSFPKSMRWAYYQQRFARPIRWILALYGEQVVDMEVANVHSQPFTYGHRFLSPQAKKVDNIPNYYHILKEAYVILDPQERKDRVWQQVQEIARQLGGRAIKNHKLLEEINYLIEYPTAFYGKFSPSYLELPPEVLTTSMIEHQRYIPVFDQEEKLMPGFIGVRNGTDYCLDVVRAGNERVLKARLEDALFFWEEDTKQPLESFVPDLEEVLFHERLGSLADKVHRLQALMEVLVDVFGLSNFEEARRAAYLCKADLVSSMVYEFPELQGVMGQYYAHKSGESEEVATAIFEHYLPRFAGDDLPTTETGILLSLAEKIDNLTGCFCIGIRPTGSQDPYALRRQALGMVNIILENDFKVDLQPLFEAAYRNFSLIDPDLSMEETTAELLDFIKQRLRGVMLERGFSYDVVEAVLGLPQADLADLLHRATVLQKAKKQPYMESFMIVFNRCNNLSKKWAASSVDENVLVDETEKLLYKTWKNMEDELYRKIKAGQYEAALQQIASLRPQLDRFFDTVMVMVEDEQLKASRLGLLKSITLVCLSIADFSKLVNI